MVHIFSTEFEGPHRDSMNCWVLNDPMNHYEKKKDKLAFSVYKEGHNLQRRLSMHFEKTKDLQNHCFVLLTDLQTIGSIYRWGKTPAGRGMQAAAMFSSSSPRPSTSKQSAKMNATTSETLYQLWAGDSRFLFPTLCRFPLPLHPDWGPPAPGGGCVILCHREKTMCNHDNWARIPNHPLRKWLGGKRRKTKDLGVTESQEKS